MSQEIFIEVDPRLKPLLERAQNPRAALAAGARAMDQENQFTVSAIQKDRLSFPATGPSQAIGCRVITNRLRGSLRATKTVIAYDSLVSSIGSNVRYALFMEEGTAPHDIVAQNGKALKFSMGGSTLFRRKVHHPGTAPRHFVRDGLTAALPQYTRAIAAAMLGQIEGGKP